MTEPKKEQQTYSEAQLRLIKQTVASKANQAEFDLLIYLATKYGLDPLTKEIWCIKYNERDEAKIFTSRDGYLKIAHASGVLDGMKSYTVDDEQGKPVKAICKVYRRDMQHPFEAEIKVSEYRQNNGTWNKYTSAMAIKVAEVFALKRAFHISGLVTVEEMGEKTEPVVPRTAVLNAAPQEKEPWEGEAKAVMGASVTKTKITDRQRLRLYTIAKSEKDEQGLGRPLPRWTEEQVKDYLQYIGYESSKDITQDEYEMLCEYFANHPGHFTDTKGQTKLEDLSDVLTDNTDLEGIPD